MLSTRNSSYPNGFRQFRHDESSIMSSHMRDDRASYLEPYRSSGHLFHASNASSSLGGRSPISHYPPRYKNSRVTSSKAHKNFYRNQRRTTKGKHDRKYRTNPNLQKPKSNSKNSYGLSVVTTPGSASDQYQSIYFHPRPGFIELPTSPNLHPQWCIAQEHSAVTGQSKQYIPSSPNVNDDPQADYTMYSPIDPPVSLSPKSMDYPCSSDDRNITELRQAYTEFARAYKSRSHQLNSVAVEKHGKSSPVDIFANHRIAYDPRQPQYSTEYDPDPFRNDQEYSPYSSSWWD
ncbi:hypothetical protein IV203_003212 [Nitzschia inconspicua]|uniref:Uncharacterized protein n=1 Tax=Nitzschia inconspicua TaxID=303405 RepID=A0A9K3L1V2_9STRA|nr:hypothetical protein IV203_003212 [Nitzschia inconspicua]